MNNSAVWTPPRSAMSQNFNGLLDRLVAKHGVADLDTVGFQAFMDAPGNGVVLLTEEPDKVAESWDTVVIFPDLLAATGARPRTAVLRPEHARTLQARFGVKRMPALLFLRDGAYVGMIEGLRDWNEFVTECTAMLLAPVCRPPSVGIPIAVEAPSVCH